MTKLDVLLEAIHPKNTIWQVSSRANSAINSYSGNSSKIKSLDDLEKVLTDFYGYVEKNVLNMRGSRISAKGIHWAQCRNILEREYGYRWHITVLDLIMSGIEGGIYNVLKTIVDNMIGNYASTEIESRVTRFWNDLSAKERFNIADEYIEKYGDYLPYDFKVGNAAKLRMNMRKVLIQHPQLIDNARTF